MADNPHDQPNMLEYMDLPLAAFVGDTQDFVRGKIPPRFRNLQKQIRKRLYVLVSRATQHEVEQLPKGYYPKKLRGEKWQYSIRVNDRYRIGYNWDSDSPHPTNIEITDHI